MNGLCLCGCGQPTTISTYTDPKRLGCFKGQPRRFIMGHNTRKAITDDYRKVEIDGHRVRLHVVRAERALGHALPKGAVVHHADGSIADDAPLVICQDQAYHLLLHARMRVKVAGGNPNSDAICGTCHQVKPRARFNRNVNGAFGVASMCRQCKAERGKRYFEARKLRDGQFWRKSA